MDMNKVGPVGGRRGGTIWDEKGRDQVAGIYVSYSEDTVYSLQFLFYENGKLIQSDKHGGDRCENFYAVVFDYPSEFLTSLSGSYDDNAYSPVLQAIKFSTSKGSYGPFGLVKPSSDAKYVISSSAAKHFTFQIGNHRLFGGFHGTKTKYAVESIGIYVKPIISSIINLKDLRVKDEKDV
ncbi:inactive protein RESTRICTED TEV MOVEMENT 1-like [Lycium barbarum]|uniref:inactive protein RESTRICTED TEV MOVEMENT 1-like n=1 Tax=Lycium barbarum TaxID=112863 RepID=UPI00293ED853|nr:inactive protein RESTRICTED TEV MOVEMENT 1-like [Lycium barbarum]XP_060180902.1 inactive protein RESTRICTED TEV MOVEMENT 1-like [Lycium barbarum]